MTKLCIFCGGRVNSQEDVWPRWLLRLAGKWPGEIRMESKRLNKHGTVDRWEKPYPEIRVGNVCQKKCNGGWMSRLEQIAKPILTPMIGGTPVTLDVEKQWIIAAWAVKCQMVFDAMDSGDVFYTAAERRQFREDRMPLDWTTIWLGHYSGPNLRLFSRHTLFASQKAEPPHKNHILTMAFGRLAIQVFCAKFLAPTDAIYAGVKSYGPWDGTTVELFPDDVKWPPSISFDDSRRTLDAFADRFGGERSRL